MYRLHVGFKGTLDTEVVRYIKTTTEAAVLFAEIAACRIVIFASLVRTMVGVTSFIPANGEFFTREPGIPDRPKGRLKVHSRAGVFLDRLNGGGYTLGNICSAT